jgi:EmrB/QacA subfamily drug resistance transporter
MGGQPNPGASGEAVALSERQAAVHAHAPSVRMHPVAAWAVLVTASLGVFVGGAELMVVAIALTQIVADFGGWADLARASWIVNAYLLAYVIAMPLAGRAADVWGALRLYAVALVLFALGSAGAGAARFAGAEDGLTWLIVARVVQGFGGGALVPLSMALASHLFSGRARATALGIEGAATFVGMAVGPAYGAWVLHNFNVPIPGLDLVPWQWIFFLNVPVAVLALLLIYVVAGGVETPRHRAGLDLVGAALLSGALLLVVAALTLTGARGWTDALLVAAFVLGALLLAAFVAWEWRRRAPLLDPRLFADRAFAAANAVSLLTGYTLATAIIGGPVFVDRVLSGSSEQAATALTALTVAIAAGAVAGGLATALVGERLTTVLGVLTTVVGLWLAAGWGIESALDRLVRDLAVYGAGFGLTVSPRATAAVEAAGRSAYGVASAMLQITRTIGMSVGLALLTSIGQNRIDELTELVNDPVRRDRLVVALERPEFVGVDPRTSLALVDLLETWSRGEASGVLRLVMMIALGVAVITLLPAAFVAGRRSPARVDQPAGADTAASPGAARR